MRKREKKGGNMKTSFHIFLILGICAMVAVLVTLPVIAQTANTVSIEDVTLAQGSSEDIPIKLLNSTGVSAGSVTLTFDPAIVNVTNAVKGDFDGVFTVDYSGLSNGTVLITAMKSGEDLTGDLTFATVTLNAVGSNGSCELGLSAELSDKTGTPVSANVNNGTFTADTTPPTIDFIAPTPADGSTIEVNYVNVTVNVADESGVSTVLLNWNGVNRTIMSMTEENTWSVTKTNLSNEIYTFKVYANDTVGNMGVSEVRAVTVEAGEDTTPPVITSVASSGITTTSATITWTTDESSDSLVKYGTTSGTYPHTISNASDVASHSISLTGLSAGTTYYYVVNSTDPSGNSAESSEHSFTTESITNVITIGDVTLAQGSSEDVPIKLLNSTGVGGGSVTLTFDPAIVNVTNAVKGDFDSIFTVDYSGLSNGTVLITAMKSGEDLTGDLPFATVTLNAVGSNGSCELGLSAELSDKTGAPVSSNVDNGTFTVGISRVPGDVTGEGDVNIQDAILLFNWDSYPSEQGTTYVLEKPENANVNGDTVTNIQDAILLFNWASYPSEQGTTYILV